LAAPTEEDKDNRIDQEVIKPFKSASPPLQNLTPTPSCKFVSHKRMANSVTVMSQVS
jgi:hypothetical protein